MNQNDVKRLQKGVDNWNRWRESERVFPDLSEANLHAAPFPGINLCQTNLSKTDLSNAQLVGASIQRSNVQFADLLTFVSVLCSSENAFVSFLLAQACEWEYDHQG
jgi:uncharacterized protein YjbI with pentapeptide repeats